MELGNFEFQGFENEAAIAAVALSACSHVLASNELPTRRLADKSEPSQDPPIDKDVLSMSSHDFPLTPLQPGDGSDAFSDQSHDENSSMEPLPDFEPGDRFELMRPPSQYQLEQDLKASQYQLEQDNKDDAESARQDMFFFRTQLPAAEASLQQHMAQLSLSVDSGSSHSRAEPQSFSQFSDHHPDVSHSLVTSQQPQHRAMPPNFHPQTEQNPRTSSLVSQIRGRVVALVTTKAGSDLLLSSIMSDVDPELVDVVLGEVLPLVAELMVDGFAHQFVERLMGALDDRQCMIVLNELGTQLCHIACHKLGFLCVQALVVNFFRHVPPEAHGQLLHVMRNSLDQLILHCTGHLLVLRVLPHFDATSTKFIEHRLASQCVRFGCDHYGLRVFKALFAVRPAHELDLVYDQIVANTLILVQDQFGNYLVQTAVAHGSHERQSAILAEMKNKFVRVAMQKYGSNVVETCLKLAHPAWRQIIIDELIAEPSCAQLLRDRFGNFVLQTALLVATQPQARAMAAAILPALVNFRDHVRVKWHQLLETAIGSLDWVQYQQPSRGGAGPLPSSARFAAHDAQQRQPLSGGNPNVGAAASRYRLEDAGARLPANAFFSQSQRGPTQQTYAQPGAAAGGRFLQQQMQGPFPPRALAADADMHRRFIDPLVGQPPAQFAKRNRMRTRRKPGSRGLDDVSQGSAHSAHSAHMGAMPYDVLALGGMPPPQQQQQQQAYPPQQQQQQQMAGPSADFGDEEVMWEPAGDPFLAQQQQQQQQHLRAPLAFAQQQQQLQQASASQFGVDNSRSRRSRGNRQRYGQPLGPLPPKQDYLHSNLSWL